MTAWAVRWNPLRGNLREQPFKPFITAAVGPVIGNASGSFVGGRTISSGVTSQVTVGGLVGGGLDIHLARSFSLGITAGYNWTANFSEPLWGHDNFNGPSDAFGIGWLWAKATESAIWEW